MKRLQIDDPKVLAGIPNNSKGVNEKYQHLLQCESVVVPKEHRFNLKDPHSLRCFKKKYQRDENGLKLYDLAKVRCKNRAEKGYLYCRHHMPKHILTKVSNTPAVDSGRLSTLYRGMYNAELGDLLEVFMNDPKMLDLKPELAQLRLIMANYVKKLSKRATDMHMSEFVSRITAIVNNEEAGTEEKYGEMIELFESVHTLSNGKAIDRIGRCVDYIGKTIERVHKYETDDRFILTPDGLKVMLRAIVDLIERVIPDDNIKNELRSGLLNLSLETNGDISRCNKEKTVEAEVVE